MHVDQMFYVYNHVYTLKTASNGGRLSLGGKYRGFKALGTSN
jgi:hypothetical protein